MEEKKPNDTDIDVEMIIKALECMAGITQRDCDSCSFMVDKFCSDTELSKATLDLIHRLQDENEELKSPKFASWKIKFFNLKEEFDKELAEHKEFTKKANAEIERLTKKAEEATFWEKDYLEWVTGFLKTRFDIKDWFTNPETQRTPCTYEFFASTLWEKIRPAMEWLDELKERNETLRYENAELQKQVDELRASREIQINELHEQHAFVADEIKQQAVKDKVEKFAERLKDEYLPIISSYFSNDEKEEEQGLNYWLCNLTDEIAKEITGVENG